MNRQAKHIWLGALAVTATLTLAACGGGNDSVQNPVDQNPTGEFLGPDNTFGAWDSEESAEAFGVETWQPVGISRSLDTETIRLLPGQIGSFVDLATGEGEAFRVESDNLQVVAPVTGGLDDGVGFPSVQGVNLGGATVSVYRQGEFDDSLVMTLNVLVEYDGEEQLIPPPECEPLSTNLEATSVTLLPTQRAVFPAEIANGVQFFAESSDEAVVVPWDTQLPETGLEGVGYIGLVPGEATVKLYAGTRESPGELLQTVSVSVIPDEEKKTSQNEAP